MPERHVLLVDGPAETETVLRTVLQPRGVAVSRVRRGASVEVSFAPSLVVLQEGSGSADWPGVPRVVIGRAPTADAADDERAIERPFDYRDLVATIDRMLTDRA